ncbi:MAG: peptidoglycan DD-metalloendopeptidase family protein [Rikenellaceae bacterium]|nr:peptidoglycan DD-metalloendopeptidase family protein [Rikenellaceae bacterium]
MIRKQKIIAFSAIGCLVAAAVTIWSLRMPGTDADAGQQVESEEPALLYGIPFESYSMDEGVFANGETLSQVLARYGVNMATVDRIDKKSVGVFNLRNLRAGQHYTAFLTPDSLRRLAYFVYEQNATHYLVIAFEGDSVSLRTEQKEVRTERRRATGTITSSLWNCMTENRVNPALAWEFSQIYAWSIDFYGLQENDRFTVIYDELYVDSTSVGIGQIWGAIFNHAGKDYYAIPFYQVDEATGKNALGYWDENGQSLRKNILKSPLRFTRISSRYSNSRLHPVLKIRRPHHGVDYAAPAGTPVHAVASGTVVAKGYSGGGGNTVKIRHAGNLMSGYLHLQGYAKGLAVGKTVNQGDLIGYVGRTGLATGPHLDFRIWQGGKPIDPLKVPSTPVAPIAEGNRKAFDVVKERILGELAGTLPDSLRVMRLDSLQVL